MDTSTPLPNAVRWHEGLLLSPQHLQQNDIYWHAHLRHRLSCITPNYWGVKKLTVDLSSLVTGRVTVTELECVLPEGLAVIFPADYSNITLDADVGKLATSDGKPVRVWLQVQPRGPACAQSDNANRRYDDLPGDTASDENTGHDDIQVNRLQTHITLYADDATRLPPTGLGACPLLDIARDAQGHLRITNYHPPMLQQDASAFQEDHSLQRQLARLTQRIWTKLEELAGHNADANADNMPESDTPIGPHIFAARHLAMALPQLEINMVAPDTHPDLLYRSLAQVVGHVACIGANPIPLKMKPYQHDDCMPQFQAAFDYIDAKLALVNTAYECLKFIPVDIPKSGIVRFAYWLPADMTGEVIIEIKTRGAQKTPDCSEWLSTARIFSRDLIDDVQNGRFLGAKARLLTPEEIKQRHLPPQANLYILDNSKIPVEGNKMQDAFRPDMNLLIEGKKNTQMPAAIILYRQKPAKHGTTPSIPTLTSRMESVHA